MVNLIHAHSNYMEVDEMTHERKSGKISDKQRVRKQLSREFDHELANEPLTAEERLNNKKTKKRQ